MNISGAKVIFIAKDYRDGAAKKPISMDGVEFLRRFTMHNPTLIRNHRLQFIPEEKPDIEAIVKKQKGPETNLERIERLAGINPCLCPVCKTGRMVIVRELPRIRPRAYSHLNSHNKQPRNPHVYFALVAKRERHARLQTKSA